MATGFPPKTSTQKDIPDSDTSGVTKDMISKGSGGIAASLKVKNASVKEAARPAESFTDRVLTENNLGKTDSDKTTGYF
jgi:hypothetical protein